MSVSVSMPQLGESVTEGTVTRWLKHEGDHVTADEPLLEVSTDKVDTEIPSPVSGVLRGITVAEDETVEVGAELAVIDEDGAAAAAETVPAGAQAAEPAPPYQPQDGYGQPPAAAGQAPYQPPGFEQAPAQAPYEQPPYERAPDAGTGYEAPPAYAEPGLPAQQQPAAYHPYAAGPGSYQEPPPAPPPPPAAAPPAGQAAPKTMPAPPSQRGTTERLSRARQVIAQRMVESLQTSAQLTTVVEADVTAIARLRDRTKAAFEAREGVKLSFLPFFAMATVEALKAHPKLNAVIDTANSTVTYHDAEHLGIAVDTERGLMVPVIRNAGDLNIGGLARKIADLAH